MQYFLQNFDSLIGCRAINKFLKRRISENPLSVLIRACCRVTLTVAKIKRGRGLAKDFATLQDSHTRPYERNSFLKKSSNERFRLEKVYNLS